MVIKRVESERVVLRWQAGADGCIGVFSRETGDELGSAALVPSDEPTSWTISIWLEDAAEHAAETLAVLTQVGLDVVGAELVEVIALADDVAGARVLERLGYSRVDRALAGDDGPVVDRWLATLSARARRAAPRIRVERGVDVVPAWVPIDWAGATTEALGHYAD
jgi:RimJ/RimL family protein N-acetyltransferase